MADAGWEAFGARMKPRSIAVALLVVGLAGTAAAEPLLLVDHSGSMKGFDATGALPEVIEQVRRTLEGDAVVLRAVADRGQEVELSRRLPPTYGGETRIFESVRAGLERYPESTTLWLLTDNVPSHGQADRDLDAFYQWLRSDEGPAAVTLFVLKLPFRGAIYAADGSTRLTSDYSAARAVVLYAALLDPAQTQRYQDALDRFAAAVERSLPRQVLRLRCKPLQDSVELQLVPGSMQVVDGVLVGTGSEGEPFRGSFEIQLRSDNEGVRFRNALPHFEVARPFRTADFDVQPADATIDQRMIEEIGSDWESIQGELALDPVRVRRSFGGALRAFLKGDDPGVVEGALRLSLEVERESVVIDPEDVRGFSTDRLDDASVEVQSRVYRLQDLFQGKFVEERLLLWPAASGDEILFTEQPEETRGQVPVRVEMSYSPISAGILFLTVALPIALVAAIALFLLRQWNTKYVLVSAGANDRPFRIGAGHAVRVGGQKLGTLHQAPLLLWFRPAAGLRVTSKRFFPREGGAVELQRRDGKVERFRFERLSKRVRRNQQIERRTSKRDPFRRSAT